METEASLKIIIATQAVVLAFFIIQKIIERILKKQERHEIKKETIEEETLKQITDLRIQLAEIQGQIKLLVASIYQVGKLEKDVNAIFQKMRNQ